MFFKTKKYLEKTLKTDVGYLVEGGGWLGINQIAGSISAFVLTIMLARFLSKETYGTYKLILSLAGATVAFSLTGTGTAIIRGVAQGNEGIFMAGVKRYFTWSFGISAVAITTGLYYYLKGNTAVFLAMLAVAIFMPIIESTNFYSSFLSGKKDFKRKTTYGLVYTIVPAISVILAAYFFKSSPIVAVTYFISTALASSFLFYRTKKTYKPNASINKKDVSFGNHLSIIGILGTISFQIDKIILFNVLGPSALATYSIAMAPPQQLRYINKVLSTLALPKFAQRTKEELQKSLPRKLLFAFLGGLLFVFLYYMASPFLFRVFFPNYLEAVRYSQAFSLLLLFIPAGIIQDSLTALGGTRALYVIQTAMPVTKIVALILFVPTFGIWGAFFAIFCSEFVRLALALFLFFKKPTQLS